MAECYQCGNNYEKSFEVKLSDGSSYQFDCFQCAVTALAPRCDQCDCIMTGPGLETLSGKFYCCDHCAEVSGVKPENIRSMRNIFPPNSSKRAEGEKGHSEAWRDTRDSANQLSDKPT